MLAAVSALKSLSSSSTVVSGGVSRDPENEVIVIAAVNAQVQLVVVAPDIVGTCQGSLRADTGQRFQVPGFEVGEQKAGAGGAPVQRKKGIK